MQNMIIDFHAHLYPEKIAAKASKAIGDFYNTSMSYKGTAEELISSGSKIGVTKYLVHSAATTEKQVQTINDFIKSEVDAHSEFVGFGTIHPDYVDFENELKRVVAMGLKGVKIHCDFQHFQIDCEKMDPIYETLTQMKLPILIHAGDERYDYDGPKRIRNVLEKHPGIIMIAAHFGGYTEWDEAMEYLVGQNVYFDTSSTTWKCPYDKANKMIKAHGADKFFFGSDFPMWDHEDEMARFNKLDLTAEEREMILYKNAQKFLDI